MSLESFTPAERELFDAAVDYADYDSDRRVRLARAQGLVQAERLTPELRESFIELTVDRQRAVRMHGQFIRQHQCNIEELTEEADRRFAQRYNEDGTPKTGASL